MPELLLELFCEEIPARLQRRAADDLKKIVTDAIVDRGLLYESAAAFVTPRRLALTITGVPARSPDTRTERKGPKTDAPQKAIDGFLRGAGLTSIDQATVQSDPKKGEFYVAIVEKAGAEAAAIFSEILPDAIAKFPWGKPMRWGAGRTQWVRPLRAITATFGTENDEPEILEFKIGDISASNQVYGHRFMAPAAFSAKRFGDYAEGLSNAKVVLDLDRRMDVIKSDAEQLAFAQGLTIITDGNLLEEVAGLVEWPVAMLGTFDQAYLELPEEVIITTIKTNQKCFCVRDRTSGKLANKFVLVSNIEASDGGKTIVAGNEKVIHARLSDAMFFYKNDLATPLEQRLPKLKDTVFHQKLGNQFDRVGRIEALAGTLAQKIGADAKQAQRAARLAKADLVTEMVFEFPELQGLMGRYYALAQGEDNAIADAAEMHYKPLGPNDEIPTNPIAISVALADKLDLLTGFWSIDEKPTGSRDPFALRRAALGVIRILIENEISMSLDVDADLLSFFHDRLKVMLRDQGARHDLVDAVISRDSRDMLEISKRVAALSSLLNAETGKQLLAGYRRGVNILAAEERKAKQSFADEPVETLLTETSEKSLVAAIVASKGQVDAMIAQDDFEGAIAALAALHQPVEAFFDAVMVNDEDDKVRENRLNILGQLRAVMHQVADFSKIEG